MCIIILHSFFFLIDLILIYVVNESQLRNLAVWLDSLALHDSTISLYKMQYDSTLPDKTGEEDEDAVVCEFIKTIIRAEIQSMMDDSRKAEELRRDQAWRIENLEKQVDALNKKHVHKVSMVLDSIGEKVSVGVDDRGIATASGGAADADSGKSSPFAADSIEAAQALLRDPEKRRIVELEGKLSEMTKDKIRTMSAMTAEIDRMRGEIADLGAMQKSKIIPRDSLLFTPRPSMIAAAAAASDDDEDEGGEDAASSSTYLSMLTFGYLGS